MSKNIKEKLGDFLDSATQVFSNKDVAEAIKEEMATPKTQEDKVNEMYDYFTYEEPLTETENTLNKEQMGQDPTLPNTDPVVPDTAAPTTSVEPAKTDEPITDTTDTTKADLEAANKELLALKQAEIAAAKAKQDEQEDPLIHSPEAATSGHANPFVGGDPAHAVDQQMDPTDSFFNNMGSDHMRGAQVKEG